MSTLALRNLPIGTDLRTLLASAPSVDYLIWWEREKDINKARIHHLCDALSSQGGTTPVLPRLARLHISGGINCPSKHQRKDHERLEELIHARASDGGSLRAVGLDYLGWCELTPESEVELHRLLRRLIVRKMLKRERDFFKYDEPAFVMNMDPPSPDASVETPSRVGSPSEEQSNSGDEANTDDELDAEDSTEDSD